MSAVSAAAVAVALASPAVVWTAFVPAAQAQAQPAAQTKNWKDRAEYDLYVSISKEPDLKKRLDLIDSWQQKYPVSDYADVRQQFLVATLGPLSGTDPSQRQRLVTLCETTLKTSPTDFTALYWLAITAPALGGATPSPQNISDAVMAANGLLGQVDTVFADAKKPAATSADAWAKAKNEMVALAHGTLGWAANANKDYPTAQKEYEASLKANPTNANVSYQLGQTLLASGKTTLYPEAIYCFARASAYDGPGSLPAASRPAISAYFKKVYKQYRGSEDGEDQLLAQAKTTALPPDGFKLVSGADIENARIAALQQRMDSDPGFKLWYTIKQSLIGAQGDAFFTQSMKGFLVPGGTDAKNFTGTVISMDPPEKPTKIVLGVEDPTKPDATLVFEDPLDVTPVIKVGDKLNFAGVADSYVKDPYMVTFKCDVEDLPDEKANKPAPVRKRTIRRATIHHAK